MFKRRFLGTILIGAVLALSLAVPAMAASTNTATSGSVELTNSQVTPFTVVNVGGGTWNYGTEIIGAQKHVWSHYVHPTKYHSATAILGPEEDKVYAVAGTWANADVYGSPSYTGYAYWATY